jgi:uncharacterized Zn-finger protein
MRPRIPLSACFSLFSILISPAFHVTSNLSLLPTNHFILLQMSPTSCALVMASTSSSSPQMTSREEDSLSQAVVEVMSLNGAHGGDDAGSQCPVVNLLTPKTYLCSQGNCKATFPSLTRLKKHQAFHSDVRPFICDNGDCLMSFKTRHHLKRHEKTHESLMNGQENESKKRKTYSCSHCDKSLKHKFDLRVHEAVHTGDKPFVCDECGASFALLGRLKGHMKRHKAYQCEKCSFVTDKWTLLQKHKVTHKIPCHLCSQTFASEKSLETHIASSHPKEKPFKCAQCSASYTRKSNLNTHIRTAHENIFFKCNFKGCEKEFAHKKSLKFHIKTQHEEKPEGKGQNVMGQKLFRRRTAYAEVVSGFEAGEKVRIEILEEDKDYRKSHEIIVS